MAAVEARRASTASSRQGETRWSRLLALPYLLPAFSLYMLFVLWPLLQVIWLAFQRWNGYGPQTFVGFRNVVDLSGDASFQIALSQSLIWEGGGALMLTIVALGLALLVRAGRGSTAALAAIFVPVLLPPTVVAAIWTLVYSPLAGLLNASLRTLGAGGLTRAWLGDPRLALPALLVAWCWSSLGLGTLIFWSGLVSIGREYLELAVVEGAGPLWRLIHVFLPALRRTAAIVLVVNAALAGMVFDLIFVTTGGGPGNSTLLLPLDMYGRAFGGRTGEGAAVACVQLLLGFVLTALVVLLSRGNVSLSSGEREDAIPRSQHWVGSSALLWLVVVLLLFPLGWLLTVALSSSHAIGLGGASLDPRSWDWSSFSVTWRAGMGGALATSALLATAGTVITLAITPPAAFALAHVYLPKPVKIVLLLLLLLGLFQPTTVVVIPLFTLLNTLGLLDTPWGILLPEVARTIPLAVLLLWGALSQAPPELLAAARVDGAAAHQQMLLVALPLVRPALVAVAIWAFVSSWNEYLLPTLVSQDGSLQTVPTLLAAFIGRYNTQYDLLAAGAVLAMVPQVPIYLILRSPAVAGLLRKQGRLR